MSEDKKFEFCKKRRCITIQKEIYLTERLSEEDRLVVMGSFLDGGESRVYNQRVKEITIEIKLT